MIAPTAYELPRVLHVDFADAYGVSRARIRTEVRRGNWRALARGAVLTRPEEPVRSDWIDLGVTLAGPSAAVTGWDATRAHGLGDRTPPSDDIVVLTRQGSNRRIGRVRIRETSRPYRVTTTSPFADLALTPIVHASRAVADAGLACRNLPSARALVTGAVQRGRCSLEDLVAELDSGPRNHSGHLRTALSDAVGGARSVAEAVAAERMTAAGLPAFELNVPIVRNGVVVFIADVLWRRLRAILEIDSREFHFSDADWKRTMSRHNALTRWGVTVTHYAPSVVTARDRAWLHEVDEWLRCRAAEKHLLLPPRTGALIPGPDGPPPLVLP